VGRPVSSMIDFHAGGYAAAIMRVCGAKHENIENRVQGRRHEHEVQLRLLDALAGRHQPRAAPGGDPPGPRPARVVHERSLSLRAAPDAPARLPLSTSRHIQRARPADQQQCTAVQKAFESGHDPATRDLLLYPGGTGCSGTCAPMDRAFGQYLARQGPGPLNRPPRDRGSSPGRLRRGWPRRSRPLSPTGSPAEMACARPSFPSSRGPE